MPNQPQTDNRAELTKVVTRWIGEAQTHPRGAELLIARASEISGDMAVMNFRLGEGKEMTGRLAGLDVWDLADAREALSAAAIKLRDHSFAPSSIPVLTPITAKVRMPSIHLQAAE